MRREIEKSIQDGIQDALDRGVLTPEEILSTASQRDPKSIRKGEVSAARVVARISHHCGNPGCLFENRRIQADTTYVRVSMPQFGILHLSEGKRVAQDRKFHPLCVPAEVTPEMLK